MGAVPRLILTTLLVLAVGASCSGLQKDPKTTPQLKCEHVVTYDVDPAFSPETHMGIDRAAIAWERGTGQKHCFIRVDHALSSDSIHFVRVGSPIEMCMATHDSDCLIHIGYWYESTRTIYMQDTSRHWALAAHEIGHMLQLSHREGSGTLMCHILHDVDESVASADEIPLEDRVAYCKRWCELQPGCNP